MVLIYVFRREKLQYIGLKNIFVYFTGICQIVLQYTE